MTPNELYDREPEQVVLAIEPDTRLVGYLDGCYYNHVPEVDEHAQYNASDRVECRIYKDFNFDGRRFWRLASIWFDGKPVMIVQNAGREGDDWAKRYVTDQKAYAEMVYHIMSLMKPELDMGGHDFVDPDTDIEDLTSFYGNELDGYFTSARY